jgi:L-ascorbate metabolism protein UlaG (beta-lactamase superfamily)
MMMQGLVTKMFTNPIRLMIFFFTLALSIARWAPMVAAESTLPARQSHAGHTELTWYGHSAFRVVTPKGHVLYIDPWLTNPVNPNGPKELESIQKADLILVSHGHFDHVGDAADIAKKTQARLVATFDLGNALVAYGNYPKEQMGYDSLGNFGGTLPFFDNEVQITFVPAFHSSSVAASQTASPQTGGNPGGFLIAIQDGPTIYHTGDTDLFGDMALVGKERPIDIMLLCIGDHFTMGPVRAAEAVALVHPKRIIPMHYGTFPKVLTGTVEDFRKVLHAKKLDGGLTPLTIGEPAIF